MNRINVELIVAAGENSLPEVHRFVRAGADVNAKTELDGTTPLHKASTNGHSQVIKELIEHGADIEATTQSGWISLHWACFMVHLAVSFLSLLFNLWFISIKPLSRV
jgi:ankyrin repeat protein